MSQLEYMAVFLDESSEHLQVMNDGLLALEQAPGDLSIIAEIFRSAHTLKGMAATMGFEEMASLTHILENVLDDIRNGKEKVTTELIDVLFEAVEKLEEITTHIREDGAGVIQATNVIQKLESLGEREQKEVSKGQDFLKAPFDSYEQSMIEQALRQGLSVYTIEVRLDSTTVLKGARVFMVFQALGEVGEVFKATPSVELLEEEKFDDTFVVTVVTQVSKEGIEKELRSISEVDHVALEPVEIASLALARQPEIPVAEPKVNQGRSKKEQAKTIRVSVKKLDQLLNVFEELVIDRGRLELLANEREDEDLSGAAQRIARVTGHLQELMLSMRMLPLEKVFSRFPRMVRQVSKELNKQIRLEIQGERTELDRSIMDEIGDPLLHLLRNSIDHGIERPAARTAAGKPAEGTISLHAFYSGNAVVIEIADDGAGINRDKVVQKAMQSELITAEEAGLLSDNDVYQLLFEPGFSTADEVTDLSGRGVGLDVVKSTFTALGGSIEVFSSKGEGSRFSIELPLMLSIIEAMLVQVSMEVYAIPIASIVETALIEEEKVYVVNNTRVIEYRNRMVPLLSLRELFDVPGEVAESSVHSVVVVYRGERLVALTVDEFIGQKEIVLKSLGRLLEDVFALSGATILGNGDAALVIDPNAFFKS
ncbi:chemotaxis protein CheA [Shouchella shacheensis]|uniref:chemotaxis protein CheA n=1 Tax=Shouchella shacheensis TaxID=1649580 RepID=UPI000A5F85C5|nr:chemotaxis protein CheA [Shouchella shacheensis]